MKEKYMKKAYRPTLIVSRHPGAVSWLASLGYAGAKTCLHLTPEHIAALEPGDRVVGTLPVQMIAELTVLGVEYLHITIQVPVTMRGQELTEQQMRDCGAKLTKFAAVELPESVPDGIAARVRGLLASINPALTMTATDDSDSLRPVAFLRGVCVGLCKELIKEGKS